MKFNLLIISFINQVFSGESHLKKTKTKTHLEIHAPNTGDQGLIPGQGTRPHTLKPRPGTAK